MTNRFENESSYGKVCVGIDEAGCGPWAGPVIAAAAIISPQCDASVLNIIRDSKQMTPSQRIKVWEYFHTFKNERIWFGVGEASVSEIDAINIREATKLAMQRAVQALPEISFDHILIDGNRAPPFSKPHSMVIKGDQKYISISSASIIAKVIRDKIMSALDEQYPVYGWRQNAGYGTALHQRAIEIYGITPFHRQSFKPIYIYKLNHNIDISANNETIYKKLFVDNIF